MISKFEELNKILKEIDAQLNTDVSIFIIGGAALLFYGLGKGYTKDIDIIINNPEKSQKFIEALTNLKFESRIKPETHRQLEIYAMMEKDEIRFDIFLTKVCGDFSLSSSMIKRAIKLLSFDKLSAHVCSKEDIVLFKSLTSDRPNDIEDSLDLIKRGIDWKIIIEELKIQAKICPQADKRKRMVWYFIERLHALKEKGVIIPIEKKAYEFYNSL